MKKNVEFIARGFIFQKGKILLCKRKDRDYYFFPGGHIEFGEFAEDALKREIKEEIGAEIKNCKPIGVLENVFKDKKDVIHEVNFVFRVKINKQNIRALEKHLEFYWVNYDEFSKKTVLPTLLKKKLFNDLKIKKDRDEIESNYYKIQKLS
ncbi:MAG TPA: NUDIX domain-containing protein [Candidatus Moranbacteria bacterium]|nr:NUDIX domain-containing protein [Candidatus Moranbacteria bacterium]